MNRNVFIVAAFAIIGIAMVIAGIVNLRDAKKEESISDDERKKKDANRKENRGNLLSTWMFGGSSDMELNKQGRLRIQIGSVLLVISLLIAYVYLIQ